MALYTFAVNNQVTCRRCLEILGEASVGDEVAQLRNGVVYFGRIHLINNEAEVACEKGHAGIPVSENTRVADTTRTWHGRIVAHELLVVKPLGIVILERVKERLHFSFSALLHNRQ